MVVLVNPVVYDGLIDDVFANKVVVIDPSNVELWNPLVVEFTI